MTKKQKYYFSSRVDSKTAFWERTIRPWHWILPTNHSHCLLVDSFYITHQTPPCWLPKILLSQSSAVLILRNCTLSVSKQLPLAEHRWYAAAFVVECWIAPRTIPSTKPCWIPWKTVRQRNAALSSVTSKNQLETTISAMWLSIRDGTSNDTRKNRLSNNNVIHTWLRCTNTDHLFSLEQNKTKNVTVCIKVVTVLHFTPLHLFWLHFDCCLCLLGCHSQMLVRRDLNVTSKLEAAPNNQLYTKFTCYCDVLK